eukprot:scaffold32745_cov29-Prasinocladus_malaysianus.AAC.2
MAFQDPSQRPVYLALGGDRPYDDRIVSRAGRNAQAVMRPCQSVESRRGPDGLHGRDASIEREHVQHRLRHGLVGAHSEDVNLAAVDCPSRGGQVLTVRRELQRPYKAVVGFEDGQVAHVGRPAPYIPVGEGRCHRLAVWTPGRRGELHWPEAGHEVWGDGWQQLHGVVQLRVKPDGVVRAGRSQPGTGHREEVCGGEGESPGAAQVSVQHLVTLHGLAQQILGVPDACIPLSARRSHPQALCRPLERLPLRRVFKARSCQRLAGCVSQANSIADLIKLPNAHVVFYAEHGGSELLVVQAPRQGGGTQGRDDESCLGDGRRVYDPDIDVGRVGGGQGAVVNFSACPAHGTHRALVRHCIQIVGLRGGHRPDGGVAIRAASCQKLGVM